MCVFSDKECTSLSLHQRIETKGAFTMTGRTTAVLFDSVEEAWFWFIAAQKAKNEGARIVAGQALSERPCEPIDILKILDSLYRQRRLTRDHLLVLRHYGVRMMPPDQYRVKEKRAYYLWVEALECMEPIMERKGIVHKDNWFRQFHNAEAMNDSYMNEELFA